MEYKNGFCFFFPHDVHEKEAGKNFPAGCTMI
jgi:hypothetical protein